MSRSPHEDLNSFWLLLLIPSGHYGHQRTRIHAQPLQIPFKRKGFPLYCMRRTGQKLSKNELQGLSEVNMRLQQTVRSVRSLNVKLKNGFIQLSHIIWLFHNSKTIATVKKGQVLTVNSPSHYLWRSIFPGESSVHNILKKAWATYWWSVRLSDFYKFFWLASGKE